ncbi:MAG TPA: hypothetical protein DCY53_12280 [Desulfobacteraceae bacterium]|nr:hypothetical protein [Desulfobacteraceae bacterium]
MNTKQAYKIIDAGWAKKRAGYRIQFQRKVDGEIVTDYFPDLDEGPWLSEVAIWRMAWRLAESRQSDPPDVNHGDLINVTVVDLEGSPIKYYAINQLEVFNQMSL